MPPSQSDHQAAMDVIVELLRTTSATMEKWIAATEGAQQAWLELRDAFVAVRMTAEIGEEVCVDAFDARHLSVAPPES